MVSIIIPAYNQHEMTQECIDTIRKHTQDDYEIVLIDNGSKPKIKLPFTGFNETILIRNKKNLGFPEAVNQGIKASHGDIIILLNNDVFVTPNWMGILKIWLKEFDIVGPCTNYCAGLQCVTIGSYMNQDELDEKAIDFSGINQGESKEVNFVIGFCMAFKKSLFDKVGLFDESLWPCSGEEIDFCLRTRSLEYKIGIAFDIYVHHEGSKTFEDMQKAGLIDYNSICERNDQYLAKKWGINFWNKQAIEGEVYEEKKINYN